MTKCHTDRHGTMYLFSAYNCISILPVLKASLIKHNESDISIDYFLMQRIIVLVRKKFHNYNKCLLMSICFCYFELLAVSVFVITFTLYCT